MLCYLVLPWFTLQILTAPHYKINVFTNDHVQSIDPSYVFIIVRSFVSDQRLFICFVIVPVSSWVKLPTILRKIPPHNFPAFWALLNNSYLEIMHLTFLKWMQTFVDSTLKKGFSFIFWITHYIVLLFKG